MRINRVKVLFAESCGKKKKMILLLNYLRKRKIDDQEKFNKCLAILKKQYEKYSKEEISSKKSIMKTLKRNLRDFAVVLEDAVQAGVPMSQFPSEREFVEKIGSWANTSLRLRVCVKREMQGLDRQIRGFEEFMAFF